MPHKPDPETLPHQELLELRSKVKKHIKALNEAGKITDTADKVSAKTLLKVLGVEADAWLCSCDTNT